jgi:acetate---CoA ligase (ADP-forming)
MAQQRSDLEEFFHPTAVALVGSVNRNAKPERLRSHYSDRWGDRWYLVNARGGSVGDIPIYEHVTDIPAEISLAVINVGTRYVLRTVEECGSHGVRYVLIFTAGFSEVGPEGARMEQAVGDMARKFSMRVFGPNTNTNAFEVLPEPPKLRGGRIGLVTQSGHQGRPIVQGTEFGVGFSRWVPTGNELDLEASDFIEYFAHDDATAVIAGYFEGFKDPSKLRRALEASNAARKPVVALKVGSTEAGTKMASSHTGHLAGSDAVVDGLFSQYGVVRVRDLDELLETAALFSKLPPGTGPNACLYSISGGSGALMAEVAESHGVPLPTLGNETQQALRELIPDYLTVSNPVDNGAQFLVENPVEDRRRVFDVICADHNVDLVVVGLTGALGRLTDRFAEDIVSFADELGKPIVVTWNSFKTDETGFRLLTEAGMPLFRSFRNCFSALRAFAGYEHAAQHFRPRRSLRARLDRASAALIDEALGAGDHAAGGGAAGGGTAVGGTAGGGAPGGDGRAPRRQVLGTEPSRRLLEAFGVPLAADAVVTSAAAAVRAADSFGYPVVMKVASIDIAHKSDAGLVRLGVESAAEVRSAFRELTDRAAHLVPPPRVEGVQVQQQLSGGTEMIVGISHDPIFGPVLLVGTGGVFAEILRDVAIRPLPVDRRDVEEMITSLRGAALLEGVRGRPRADTKALVNVTLAVAKLATACGDRLAELDLNPIVVRERGAGAVAVDSLVILERDAADLAAQGSRD